MPVIHGPSATVPLGEITGWGFRRYEAGRKAVVEPHFHDCDEYYMVVSGRMVCRSEGRAYTLGPGDILATYAGDEHEIVEILEDVEFVWLEKELKGLKRRGHLQRGEAP